MKINIKIKGLFPLILLGSTISLISMPEDYIKGQQTRHQVHLLTKNYQKAIKEDNFKWIKEHYGKLITIYPEKEIRATAKSILQKLYEQALETGNLIWLTKHAQDLIFFRLTDKYELKMIIEIIKKERKDAEKKIQHLKELRQKTEHLMMQEATPNNPEYGLMPIINLYREIEGENEYYKMLNQLTSLKDRRQLYENMIKMESIPEIASTIGKELGMLRGYMRYRQWIAPEKMNPQQALKTFETMAKLKDYNAMIDLYQNFLKNKSPYNFNAERTAFDVFNNALKKNDIQAVVDLYLNILKNSIIQKEAFYQLHAYALQNAEQHDSERLARLMPCFEDHKEIFQQLNNRLNQIRNIPRSKIQQPQSIMQLHSEYEEALANNNIGKLLELKDQLISAGIIPDNETFQAIITSLIE